jgi:uncharacterized protein involved in outer membrane biogenesis
MRNRIISGVVLAISGVLILAVLNINFLVRRNKDYVIGRLEQALDRRVTVEQIDLTLWPLGARLVKFAIADDSAFSAGELFRAAELRADLRILPLLAGRLRFNKIFMQSPVISIVRDAKGRFNFMSHADHEKNPGASADRGKRTPFEKQGVPVFLAPLLNVSGGTVNYRDIESGRGLTATQIELKVAGSSREEPFDIELQAAVMTAKPNLRFRSRMGPIAESRDYQNLPLDGEIDADALDLGRINKALPQLRKALPRALRFDGIYTIQELRFKGTLNNLSLKGVVTGTDASFRFE